MKTFKTTKFLIEIVEKKIIMKIIILTSFSFRFALKMGDDEVAEKLAKKKAN